MNFKELGLSDLTLKAIEEIGYTEPTQIQKKAIPLILRGSDVVGIAQTGTGKTGSFSLPMIDILASGKAKARIPRSLILAPTRELAMQIAENFVKYGKYQHLSMALLIGGEPVTEQQRLLNHGVDVLIATPGRMIDLFERGQVIMTGIKILVIDEADRMLDMGFIPDVKRIISLTSRMRQTLLFSATMDKEIKSIAQEFMSMPQEVFVTNPSSAAKTISHSVVYTDTSAKKRLLCDIIDSEKINNAMIFCNKKRDVEALKNMLASNGYSVGMLHGDIHQSLRFETIESFRNGDFKILVCSDVAARGLDLPDVSHVFLFDVPFKSEDYVHRIGRTGRAGKEGKAFTLVTDNDFKALDTIEKILKKPLTLCTDFGEPEEFEIRRNIARKNKYKSDVNPNKHKQSGKKHAVSTPAAETEVGEIVPHIEKRRTKKHKKSESYVEEYDTAEVMNPADEQRIKAEKAKQIREANPYISPQRAIPAKGNGKDKEKSSNPKAFGEHTPAFFGINI